MASAYSSLAAITIFLLQYRNLSHFTTRTVGAIKTGKADKLSAGKRPLIRNDRCRQGIANRLKIHWLKHWAAILSPFSAITHQELFSMPVSKILPCSHQQGQALSPAPDLQHIYKPVFHFSMQIEKKKLQTGYESPQGFQFSFQQPQYIAWCPFLGKLSPGSQLPCIQQVPAEHTQCQSYSSIPSMGKKCFVLNSLVTSPFSGLSGLKNSGCLISSSSIPVGWKNTKDRYYDQ